MTHKLNCAYCNRPFTAAKKKLCCTRACSNRYSRAQRGLQPWRPDEELWLEEVVGTMPLVEIWRKHCRNRRGWPRRSQERISDKISRMKLSRKCTLDSFTRADLSRLLGVGPDRVRGWARRGLLEVSKISTNKTAIKVKDFCRFALAHPAEVSDADREALAWLMGDEAAERCKAVTPKMSQIRRPVRCIDTGEVFPGVKAAAKAKYLRHQAICDAIRRGGTSAGCRWEYVA